LAHLLRVRSFRNVNMAHCTYRKSQDSNHTCSELDLIYSMAIVADLFSITGSQDYQVIFKVPFPLWTKMDLIKENITTNLVPSQNPVTPHLQTFSNYSSYLSPFHTRRPPKSFQFSQRKIFKVILSFLICYGIWQHKRTSWAIWVFFNRT